MNNIFVILALIGVGLPLLAPGGNRRIARRIFWAGFLIAAVSAFFIAYPPDIKKGLAISLFAAGLMLLRAFFNTPYIKIRGKIYAYSIQDSQPDPPPEGAEAQKVGQSADESSRRNRQAEVSSYGGLATAEKSWWLMVPVCAVCSMAIADYLFGKTQPTTLLAVAAVGVLATLAAARGYQDGSGEYPVARGQRMQFIIISIITIGFFPVLYLGAYRAGKY